MEAISPELSQSSSEDRSAIFDAAISGRSSAPGRGIFETRSYRFEPRRGGGGAGEPGALELPSPPPAAC
jgi:hypothetical protein